ncbi:hypothetical protein RJJ65_41325, partial [Rhizobium hidalgonense]
NIRQSFASTPGTRLVLATGLILIALVMTTITALNQPYSGLGFALSSHESSEPDSDVTRETQAPATPTDSTDQSVLITHSQHLGIPVPSTVMSLQVGNNPPIALT